MANSDIQTVTEDKHDLNNTRWLLICLWKLETIVVTCNTKLVGSDPDGNCKT
jgi:hypothetical protein